MVTTDPIADMLVRLKNAGRAGKAYAEVPYSAMKLAIANILLGEGLVVSVTKKMKKGDRASRVIEIGIAYDATKEGVPKRARIRGIERVSKPSRRVYAGVSELKPVQQGHGIMILSTPKGVLTDIAARKEHCGGEVLLKAW